MEGVIEQQRSLAETPTYSVASVVTVMVFVCLLVERSIYRFGKWLKKTRRKALLASLEKIKEELMLLGLISLLLAQSARWISEICVNSSLFTSRFYICSENDYSKKTHENVILDTSFSSHNVTDIPAALINLSSHQCGEGREPFVSYEGLEQLHRFLFVLGITHVLYSCVAVGLSMSKIYSWGKWENQAGLLPDANLQPKKNKVMRRQSTFVFQHTSHPWSRHRILIWMVTSSLFLGRFYISNISAFYDNLRVLYRDQITWLCVWASSLWKHRLPHSYNFHRYIVRSMEDEFQGILGISWPLWGYAIVCIFVNIHGLNIYFWLSFIPAILVILVGTKLQHVVSSLALEIVEQTGLTVRMQVKPRDDLFWFGKPVILLRLIQFIIFQNAFEMATFFWSLLYNARMLSFLAELYHSFFLINLEYVILWGLKERSCFMKNHIMIVTRVIVQFWCSHSTVPLNVIVTQFHESTCGAFGDIRWDPGVRKPWLLSVRVSLHSWCKRVKERSKHSNAARSVCSLDATTIDERDEITVASGTLSRSSSLDSLHQVTIAPMKQPDSLVETTELPHQHDYSFRVAEYLADSVSISASQHPTISEDDDSINGVQENVDTLLDLFQKTLVVGL